MKIDLYNVAGGVAVAVMLLFVVFVAVVVLT